MLKNVQANSKKMEIFDKCSDKIFHKTEHFEKCTGIFF